MPPSRRAGLLAVLGLALATAGSFVAEAATCRPLREGSCHACKNCRYCGHCAKRGGVCSVCR